MFEIEVAGIREVRCEFPRVALLNAYEPAVVGIWQRAEQNAVDHAEDRRACPDAEPQRQDAHECENRTLPQYSQRVTNVLEERLGHRQSSKFAMRLSKLRYSSQPQAGGALRLLWLHTSVNVLLRE